MKIDLISHRYPPDLGGIERHVQELARFFSNAGHDVTVHATRWRLNQPRQHKDDDILIYRHPALAPTEAYYLSPSITAAVLRSNADVVHAHGYHSLPLLFAALGVRDIPFVVTPHYTGRGSTALRDVLHRLYTPLGSWALKKADKVIAVSEWEKDELSTNFNCQPIVVPNGIDINRFINTSPLERERPYLLSIGRLVEYKGVQHIIRALPKLPDFDLLIAGTGEYQNELYQLTLECGVEDRVEFLGYVDEEQIPSLYAGAAAHIFLSEYECYGLTVSESLAAGTPCVVLDATALTEWDSYVGCISVSSVQPESIANAVRRILTTEPEPEALVTWAEMGGIILNEYEKLISDLN